jgi:uncharacterized protein YcbK (DUF882 family)
MIGTVCPVVNIRAPARPAARRVLRMRRTGALEVNMRTLFSSLVGILLAALAWSVPAAAAEVPRFFFSGDGQIRLTSAKSGEAFAGRYRTGPRSYAEEALQAIHRVYGAPYRPTSPLLSLRLIEFLDFLEDRLQPGALITIASGYRPPEYNQQLRRKGALAARASLHQYGMAADVAIEGVSARRLWETVKTLGFGGAGYYHGDLVHIDVGPARFWDETTSGVHTGISDDNKLIGLVTEADIHLPGEMLGLRFIRMTAFPIGVAPEFVLERGAPPEEVEVVARFQPVFTLAVDGACPRLADIDQMAGLQWRLPETLAPGRYRIRARFCERAWEAMPAEVTTPEFEVARP